MSLEQLKKFLSSRENVKIRGSTIPILKKDREIKQIESDWDFQMSIMTNSISPTQDYYFSDWTWDEIISESCFDDSLQKDLFSFLDHNISIENTIASTKNGTMKVEKKDGNYIAYIKLDKTIKKNVELLNKINNGLVTENSFIFLAGDVEYQENKKEKHLTVIHKKADLISIDPVIQAFYPQNKIISFDEREKMELEKIKKRDSAEEDDIKKEDQDETESKKDSEKGDEKDAAKEAVKADKEEAEAAKDAEKEKKAEPVDADIDDDAEPDYKKMYEELKASIETSKDKKDDENAPSQETEKPDKKENGEKISSEDESKRNKKIQILRNLPRKDNFKNMDKKQLIKSLERKALIVESGIANNPVARAERITQDEKDAYKEHILNLANESGDVDAFFRNLEISTGGAITRDLDASSYNTGTAFVAIFNDPEVKTQLEKAFPELKGANFVNIDSLDIVKKDLLIPTNTIPTVLKEGEKSPNLDGTTVSVTLNPKRYSWENTINPALANATQTMEANTKQAKSAIISVLRTDFYKNLFENATTVFASLGDGDYKGGFTKDARIPTQDPTKVSLVDFDNLIDNAEAIFGDEVYNYFVFLMNPSTKTFILNTVRTLYHGNWITDENGFTYRNIPIIAAPQFKGKVNVSDGTATDTWAAVFCRKDCIIARGLNFVTQDNIYIKMSEGLISRFTHCRGEVKLIDPFLNTRALWIGEVGANDYTFQQILAMNKTELEALDDKTLTKKQQKAKQKRLQELNAQNP